MLLIQYSKSPYQPPLPTDNVMDLLHLCLTSTYFQYNSKHYKQLHVAAMGSRVSVVVAEIVMQNIEEQAQATYSEIHPGHVTLTIQSLLYAKTKLMNSMNA